MITDSPGKLRSNVQLADDAIDLRLIRILAAGDESARPPEARFLSSAEEYRFAIHRLTDGLRVGRIHMRATNDESITHILGHTGYAVDEGHRGNGYATRALRLVVGLARACEIAPLWTLIEPDNLPSRKVAEKAGFHLVDIVDASSQAIGLGHGPKLCRYAVEFPL